MDKQIPTNFEFPIIISEVQEVSQTLSKGRVRIFYKYENRNGSYITDEFAEKLLSTLPYAPVKGIYDNGSGDYLDHGVMNTQGRIYGIVPADPHVTWERHLDEDGVEREYATCDVILYTALYEEANKIIGKAQSMELYPPSINGRWEVHNGQEYFTFIDGCFFGLQVLGDEVEPCFEGAGFFSLNEYKGIVDLLNMYVHQNGGKSNMNTDEIVSSEVQVEEPVTEFAVEETPTVVEAVTEDTTEFAAEEQQEEVNTPVEAPAEYEADTAEAAPVEEPAAEFKDAKEEKKDEEPAKEDEPENGEPEGGDVPEDGGPEKKEPDEKDKNACDDKDKCSLTSEGYEAQITELQNEINNYCAKISELEGQISTLNMEKEAVELKYTASEEKIVALNEENNKLSAFKHDIEKKQKEDIIASYAEMLNGEVIDEFTAKIDEFDAISLDKELAYALKNTNMAAFAKTPAYIPKEEHMDALSEILSRYIK